MFDKIQQIISSKFNLSEKKGLFISGFDSDSKLILSFGKLVTDKTLEENINEFIKKLNDYNIKFLIIDVVKNIVEVSSPEEIKKIDIKNWGLAIVGDRIGAILPNTKGIPDSITAISLVVKKNNIKEKKVDIYKFSTERFFIK